MLTEASTVVIWNPSAGTADRAESVRESLQSLANVRICEPAGREESICETLRAAKSGAELVIAAGGDGTVSTVIEGLMQSRNRPRLGILPVGTGNDLARALEIPLDVEEAYRCLLNPAVVNLDVVQLSSGKGRRCYANMLTGGNTGRYLEHMDAEMKARWGPLCYLRGVIDVLRDLQVYRVQIICDEGPPRRFDALNIFAANGRYSGGGLAVSPGAQLDDGLIDLVVIHDGDPGDIVSLTSSYVVSDYLEHELVTFHRARRITISTVPEMELTADGDAIGHSPVTLSSQPRALQVARPQPADESLSSN